MLLDNIKNRIDKAEIISFDIFDTLLLRPYVKPVDLFTHIGQLQGMPFFSICRQAAEKETRAEHPSKEDIRFDQIYQNIDETFKPLQDIEINWEECISYGATCKLQNIALPSVAWLYFSKKAIDAKKAFKRAPQSGKDIIFVSVKGNMLEEIKNYIPEHIYTKIYSDLIIREYPIAKE